MTYLALLIGLAMTSSATESPSLLNRTIEPLFSAGAGINHEVYALCWRARPPCGLQMATSGPEDNLPAIEIVKPITVRELLKLIMTRHPNYRWRLDDGVLDVLPRSSGLTPRSQHKNPLRIRVSAFSVAELPSDQALQQLCDMSGISFTPKRVQYLGPLQPTIPITLDLKKVSALDALNQIAKSDGQITWILDYKPYDGGMFSCRVESWRSPTGR